MSVEVNGILVAAHELKAPLCLVRQLALALDFAEDAADRSKLQHQIIEVSERALSQVNDLTRVARLEDGLFAMEPVSVRGVCDEVLREVAPLFKFEDQRIQSIYRNKSRLAVANRELLYSVIYNFCTNALHYADAGLRSILAVQDIRGKIRISVRDFGPALPAQVWRELRRGGVAAPTDIAMRPGSSGLGLYIASQFARYMRAELGAIRHRDGTSFFIELPVSKQAELWG